MSEHHHHHRKDSATRFKERSLNAIVRHKMLEKWLMIILCVIAVVMMIAVVVLYNIA
jgi:cell division protein FtsL